MIPVAIDELKCTGRGLCAGDCPNACLCVEGGKAHRARALLCHLPARGSKH